MKHTLSVAILCSVFNINVCAQSFTEIPLVQDLWEVTNKSEVSFERFEGRQAVQLDGAISLIDTALEEGIISVDIYCSPERSFSGMFFHQEEENSEKVYFRQHKSGQADALQYTPIFHGESNWQLYGQYQANIDFKVNQWNNLKIEFNKRSAILYVNSENVLIINDLKCANPSGNIGLWSLFPSWFSNFSISYAKIEIPIPHASASTPDPDVISSWELSRNFAIDSLPYYTSHATNLDYFIAFTDPDGMLPISKYVKKNSGGQFEANNEDFVIAKIDLNTLGKIRIRIFFDYSDKCVVMLNGTEIFRGNNAFRSKGIQFTGHLNVNANCLSLDLEEGENILQFFVIEKANGWGLIGKLENESKLYHSH